MPKPQEICVVTANGQRYDIWETVECTHGLDPVFDYALMTVSEPSTGAKRLSDLKLKPGDRATVTLAGQTIIDGFVYLRQAAIEKQSHAVQIGVASDAQRLNIATVAGKPGQYTNQTLQQIASAVFAPIKFSIRGNPPGADKPFPRVSEQIGETKFDFIERLGRMRNIHIVDDGRGGIVGFRGPNGGASDELLEGYNILRGRLILRIDEHNESIKIVATNFNQDIAGANAHPHAEITVDPPFAGTGAKYVAEHAGDSRDAEMRANHESDQDKLLQVDGDIVVQGWLNREGNLWWNDREKIVTLRAPLLLPNDSMKFMIKGIVHRQSSEEGTTTSVLLCKEDGTGLNTGERLQYSAAPE